VQSKHTSSFSRFGRKSDPKSLPKWSPRAPQITQNQEKQALKKTLKNNTAKSGFVVAFCPQKGTPPFVAERSPKSQKSEHWAQNVFQASRRGSQAPKILKNHQKISPQASKITQNHKNLVTQNQENQKKEDFKT